MGHPVVEVGLRAVHVGVEPQAERPRSHRTQQCAQSGAEQRAQADPHQLHQRHQEEPAEKDQSKMNSSPSTPSSPACSE